MHEAAGAAKQTDVLTSVSWGTVPLIPTSLSDILSRPPHTHTHTAPLHLWKYTFHHDGSPASFYMMDEMTKCSPTRVWWSAATRVCDNRPPFMWSGPLWTESPPRLLEQECELTEPCLMGAPLWAALLPIPPVLDFLSSFIQILCLCWMSETQLSHTRQSGEGSKRVVKEKSRKRTASLGWEFVVLNFVVSYNWMTYWLIALADQFY